MKKNTRPESNRRILITGGCGFVGSNLAVDFKKKYPHYQLIALDNLKRNGSELNINRLKKQGIKFIHGDIRNQEDLDQVGKINTIIDASAEPSVLAGITSSLPYLINTNLNGTINCLFLALKNRADFIFLSTSRVYPIEQVEKISFLENTNRFYLAKKQIGLGISSQGISENFSLKGYRSFYGACKLASELIIQEFNKLLGIKTVVNRCALISGPYQMGQIEQGVIALWVAKHFWKGSLAYIGYEGKGKQVRDILHINDLFNLLDYQIHNINKVNGETFNVGGGIKNSLSLKELTLLCQQITGNKIKINKVKKTRQVDIRIYITDNTKVSQATGWQPKLSPKRTASDIYKWLCDNEKVLKNFFVY